jgi:transcriptional regulator with XRE-family HTH domain
MTRQQSKVTLKRKGWSQRQAAKTLGIGFEHLNRVLNGHRESKRLLAAIESLPEAKR